MSKLTPMMEQYFEIKKEYNDCLVFFRLGDFYELFYDDALIASKELEITLTARDCGQSQRAPMCGVPHHSAEGYIAKLVSKGYKVAICEQMESPKGLKTIVKREVIRVVTPGTVMDPHMLEEGKNSYIMCVFAGEKSFGLAVADITTGEFLTTTFSEDKNLMDEVARFMPREILVSEGFHLKREVESLFGIKPQNAPQWSFDMQTAEERICRHFGTLGVQGLGLDSKPESTAASGALLEYLAETQKNSLRHISSIRNYSLSGFMALDVSSRRNLELTETLRDKSKKGSLLWVLDKTKTAMGARLLRKWIEQPSLNEEIIAKKLNAVEELKNGLILREELRGILNTVYDIERISSKIIYGTAHGRDLTGLKSSFRYLPEVKRLISSCTSALISELSQNLDTLSDLHKRIDQILVEAPPVSIKDGGLIQNGFDSALDKYREAKENGNRWLAELEATERNETGIKNLKVRYNKIFGYCIEVTNSHFDMVPERYVRRQTLANCERFITPALKEIEETILGADEKIVEMEYDIFVALREELASHIERIQLTAGMLATLDALQSLAEVADKNNYVKPTVDNSGVIEIKNGRHPVVEQMVSHGFVPNDTILDRFNDRLAIITGPNMAGKSTYMRQTALIVLMAQAGSFIPAESGHIGVVDRIFTRVGASDDLATGQSTFMVEMSEVANILHNATPNSLLILDEIGRGTSTFDGLSIAWAVLEYISHRIGAKTLFATHYHELTELEGKVDGVRNYRVTVQESGKNIIFLRKIALGGADNSYGIHVARLAGLPESVLMRSNEILDALSRADVVMRPGRAEPNEPELFYKKPGQKEKQQGLFLCEIIDLDVDALTPREALRRLYDIQQRAKEVREDCGNE